ncbi:MAG: tRNA (N(6)-L-threonylcarbamoyladenosine(37)-C(2))-methylthiotransferase MtaB [Bacteroidia bacterium]|nr:MAG: tRNA (N(6)-L-threonylcarbamoyladenosine(37)-C(2))-methylthiotransferase MtaB [Bacteroidia bacterium]
MRHVAFHTLGCKLNFSETAAIARQFTEHGFREVDLDQQADVVVLNTCSVTARADRECRQIIRRARRRSPDAYVIVIGCYAQLQPKDVAAIDGVNLVLGTAEKFRIFEHADWLTTRPARVKVSPISSAVDVPHASSVGFSDRTRTFLKIQDGCDYTCSFCTIPLARGTSRSIPVHEIVAEARSAAEQGCKEIVLTGVNVGDYGRKIGTSLLTLLKDLVRVDGIERIRISSIEPNLLSDALIDFWASTDRLCNHFHIPLQSGSDQVLKAMQRRYRRARYADRIEKISALVPGAAIGADVIVGFPGETETDFEETYSLLVDLPVTYLHVFSYSERPNTPAAGFPGSVPPADRAVRSERLRILSARKRRLFHESMVGSVRNVLFEGEGRSGLTEEYVRVNVKSDHSLEGKILPVAVEDADETGCRGRVIADERAREEAA